MTIDLLLVRHAMPAIEPAVPPHEWSLSDEGRAAAAALRLPPDPYLVASGEPKAWQTLEPAGPVIHDARFGEIRREGEPWEGPYRELRRSYVDGADHPGWERRADVARRFDEGVDDHLVRAEGRPVVIGSHGMAITVWLTARTGLTAPGDFWAALRFPDVISVDLSIRRVHLHAQ
jgi:broad specificity phosphatase PhoE